ncbi:MAG: hypothetical protein AUJ21_07840 [Anaerolineae bacterium CG1_02_58_13]|nr:MAG: hypothetical protein AUJ21_07840 [Anaerolineae bacterium CG1_02_58_13]
MKTSKKVLIAGILIAAVSLLGILWGISATNAQPYQHPKPSPTPEILENGWYRFADAEAGYSFDYPPSSLSISIGKDKGEKYNHLTAQFSSIDGYGYQGMVLYIIPNPKKLSLEEFLLKEFKGKWTKKLPPENLSQTELGDYLNINGYTAIKTTLPTYVELETAPFFVYIEGRDKIIATGPMYGLMNASEIAPGSVELFMQILATFNLIP